MHLRDREIIKNCRANNYQGFRFRLFVIRRD